MCRWASEHLSTVLNARLPRIEALYDNCEGEAIRWKPAKQKAGGNVTSLFLVEVCAPARRGCAKRTAVNYLSSDEKRRSCVSDKAFSWHRY